MSISVDDPGVPTSGNNLTDAIAGFRLAARNSGVHPAYKRALRYGTPGSRHHITIRGEPVTIIIATKPCQPADPARERASWNELRTAIINLADTTGHIVTTTLPAEIAAAIWQRDGKEIRVCRPGHGAALRRARLRRHLSALSPLPLLGAITQPLAGSAAAVGIIVAPLPPMYQPDFPPPPVMREMTGDIARPELPYAPGTVTPTPAGLPLAFRPATPAAPPVEATARDTTPQPPRPPLINPAPATTPPPPARTTPAPGPAPTPTLDATPTPTVPVLPPAEEPTTDTGSDPDPSPAPTPSVAVTRMLDQILHPTPKPRRHVHKRHKHHPLRGIRRHH